MCHDEGATDQRVLPHPKQVSKTQRPPKVEDERIARLSAHAHIAKCLRLGAHPNGVHDSTVPGTLGDYSRHLENLKHCCLMVLTCMFYVLSGPWGLVETGSSQGSQYGAKVAHAHHRKSAEAHIRGYPMRGCIFCRRTSECVSVSPELLLSCLYSPLPLKAS